MNPTRIAIIVIMTNLIGGGAVVALFRNIRRRERDVNDGRLRDPIAAGIHTADVVRTRQRAAIGPATAALYGLIGDTLDQGRWVKPTDSLLAAFKDNPQVLIDALIEWGFVVDDDDEEPG